MNTKTLILIIVGVVVVVGGNIALTVFLLGDRDSGAAVVAEGEAAEPGEGAAEDAGPTVIEEPIYVRIDAFTVTFDEPNSARFLQIEAYVVVDEDEDERLIERHMPALRSALVMLFASQTSEGLSSASGKERLRSDALEVVRETFRSRVGQALAEDFLFTKFVMQ